MERSDNSPETTRAAGLSESHARALGSHFKTVEEYLRVVDSWLDGVQGVFYQADSELSEEERARARVLIAGIFGDLGRVRKELDLPRQELSAVGVMRAYLSELWVSLAETRARHLNGYGEVPAEVGDYLDCRVDELEQRVGEVRRIIEAAGKRAQTAPPAGAIDGPR